MKFSRAFSLSCIFLLILLSVYYLHAAFFKVDVVFYAAIQDVFISVIIAGFVMASTKQFLIFNPFEKIQLVAIWLLVGYSLAISVPTVIDRSLSFYILEKLQQRGGGIRQDAFETVFTQEYVKEHHLVDVRLTEQIESGTIVISNGCIILTGKGNNIASFGRYFRQNWLPKERLLMGHYSDALTDPFKNSQNFERYKCP